MEWKETERERGVGGREMKRINREQDDVKENNNNNKKQERIEL